MFAGHFDFTQPLVWTVDDVLDAAACDELRARVDAGPWLDATVNRAEGRAVDRVVRNNQLVLVDDATLADALLARLRPRLPERLMGMTLSGIKQRMRCYRYRVGEYFAPHGDQSYPGGPGERSLLTLMIYLNDDFAGGQTAFLELDKVITPLRGRALLFQPRGPSMCCAATSSTGPWGPERRSTAVHGPRPDRRDIEAEAEAEAVQGCQSRRDRARVSEVRDILAA